MVLYLASFSLVFFVMLIRPLSNIFPKIKLLRMGIFLRKGFGVLSSSIIVGFIIGKIITPDSQYLLSIFTKSYWSLDNYALFAHIGDIIPFLINYTTIT